MLNNNGASRGACTALFCVLLPLGAAAGPKPSRDTARARLEVIVVTGEKVRRSLMDTASSVAVLDSEDLQRRPALDTLADALQRIPNLVGVEPGNLAPAVRGTDGTGPAQGADAFFAGTRPRLSYQVDGRTLSYNESIFADATLWDVERVEVYRGPQSTLQGRNAVAGAVITTTRGPVYEFEGGLRAVAGNDDTRQYSGYLSGPLVDEQLAFRVAVDQRQRDSFVRGFEPYPGVDDPGEYESLAVRGKLLYEPRALPDFSALLTANHLDAHAPQDGGVVRPFDQHRASYPPMPRFGTRANGAILDLNWAPDGTIGLQALVSATDLEVTRDALPGDGNVEIDAEELLIEPRLDAQLMDERLEGFVALHHFRSEQDEYIDLFGGGSFDDSTETDAVFTEFTYRPGERLDLTLGGRYERERRDREGSAGIFIIDFEETYTEFLPRASVAWHPARDLTLGMVVGRGYNGGGAGFTYEPPFQSYTYDPEYVKNYELFARGLMLGGSLQLTANIFYNDYDDIQLPFDLNPDPAIWSQVVRNADKATTYGAEGAARWLARPGLELYASLGLLTTEIDRYPGSGLEGNELPRSPAYSFNAGVNYGGDDGLELALDLRMSDSYYSDVINEARGKTDPYWIANARLGYRFEHLHLFAEVSNLFDSDVPLLLTPGATRADDVATLPWPRSATVGAEYTF